MNKEIWEKYTWLTMNEAAQYLGVEAKRVRSWVKDNSLPAVKPSKDRPLLINQDFLVKNDQYCGPLDTLKGTVTLLLDGGLSQEEAVEWIVSTEESLGQTPLSSLLEGKKHLVRTLAAALAL